MAHFCSTEAVVFFFLKFFGGAGGLFSKSPPQAVEKGADRKKMQNKDRKSEPPSRKI